VTANDAIVAVSHLSREVIVEGAPKAIVNDFSFEFQRGGIYTILGPSGAGKSSFLRLINRLDEPTSGEIAFDGRDYREYAPTLLRQRVGYLFQTPMMFPGTVKDNILFANGGLDDARVDQFLAAASVKTGLKDQRDDKLSGGEKQRVALARLLATKPSVILLDEPTSALDPTYTEMIEKVIKKIVAEKNLTAIMVSHSPDQAVRMNGVGLLLAEGRLIEHGPIKDMVENPQTELGRRYRDRELT
jgi:UDP-glucose/iron transport system ATP-binding protein